MKQIPVMILAGGKATRMGGGDKPLLLRKGRALIDWILDDIRHISQIVAVNANGDPQRFDPFGLPVVPDSVPDCGPLSGILTAMEWAADHGHTSVLVVAGDTLNYPSDLLDRLGDGPAFASSYQNGEWRSHPTVGVWPVSLASDLRRYLEDGNRRLMGWAKSIGAQEVRFDGDVFRNFNTPEDLSN